MLTGELIVRVQQGMRRLSQSTFSNIFSSETTVPTQAKFHVKRPWGGERTCSGNSGHMTKIKNLLQNQRVDCNEIWLFYNRNAGPA